ncbi:hypothetical protein RR46_06845 [Papilio xuthus]|uniref:Uncharacterized protein n=1 Tax=Papilio xuthus TaxID=66420 RepID=A0A194PRN6_PAPXU|nr:hypothetical protein RR46_06845 [Papilio xuthus]
MALELYDLVSEAEIPTPERALLHKLEIENKRIAEDAKAHCLPKTDKMHSRKGSDTSVISVTSVRLLDSSINELKANVEPAIAPLCCLECVPNPYCNDRRIQFVLLISVCDSIYLPC